MHYQPTRLIGPGIQRCCIRQRYAGASSLCSYAAVMHLPAAMPQRSCTAQRCSAVPRFSSSMCHASTFQPAARISSCSISVRSKVYGRLVAGEESGGNVYIDHAPSIAEQHADSPPSSYLDCSHSTYVAFFVRHVIINYSV